MRQVDAFIDEIELMLKKDEISRDIGCYGQDLKHSNKSRTFHACSKPSGALFNTGECSER
jgi:hypothetical protein